MSCIFRGDAFAAPHILAIHAIVVLRAARDSQAIRRGAHCLLVRSRLR